MKDNLSTVHEPLRIPEDITFDMRVYPSILDQSDRSDDLGSDVIQFTEIQADDLKKKKKKKKI